MNIPSHNIKNYLANSFHLRDNSTALLGDDNSVHGDYNDYSSGDEVISFANVNDNRKTIVVDIPGALDITWTKMSQMQHSLAEQLLRAAAGSEVGQVRGILARSSSPEILSARNSEGKQAIHLAVAVHALKIVKLLVEKGSPVNEFVAPAQKSSLNSDASLFQLRDTPLTLAIKSGRDGIIDFLLQNDAAPMIALMGAINDDDSEVVQYILRIPTVDRKELSERFVPRLDNTTRNWYRPLQLTAALGRAEILTMLLSYRVPDRPTRDYGSAVHVAITHQKLSIALHLLQIRRARSWYDIKDADGNNILLCLLLNIQKHDRERKHVINYKTAIDIVRGCLKNGSTENWGYANKRGVDYQDVLGQMSAEDRKSNGNGDLEAKVELSTVPVGMGWDPLPAQSSSKIWRTIKRGCQGDGACGNRPCACESCDGEDIEFFDDKDEDDADF